MKIFNDNNYFYFKIYVPKKKTYFQIYLTPSVYLEIGRGCFNISIDFLLFNFGFWHSRELK